MLMLISQNVRFLLRYAVIVKFPYKLIDRYLLMNNAPQHIYSSDIFHIETTVKENL